MDKIVLIGKNRIPAYTLNWGGIQKNKPHIMATHVRVLMPTQNGSTKVVFVRKENVHDVPKPKQTPAQRMWEVLQSGKSLTLNFSN